MHEISLRFIDYMQRAFDYLVNRDKIKLSHYVSILNARISKQRIDVEHMFSICPIAWYFDFFYFTRRVKVFIPDSDSLISLIPDSFYCYRGLYLKVPNVLDNMLIGYFYGSCAYFLCFGSYLSILNGLQLFYIWQKQAAIPTIILEIMLPVTFILLVFQIFGMLVRSQNIHVPYLIFDSVKRSVVICGTGSEDEHVSFQNISFNLLQIEESLDHCAIEMRIERLGLSPTLMVTDICMSQVQAKGVLKTYYAILNGTLVEESIKKYRPVLKDFNLNFFDGLLHLNEMTFSWFKTVLPHGFGFYCVHGPAMGVLKRYINTQSPLPLAGEG